MLPKGKGEHAIEVYVVETRRRDIDRTCQASQPLYDNVEHTGLPLKCVVHQCREHPSRYPDPSQYRGPPSRGATVGGCVGVESR